MPPSQEHTHPLRNVPGLMPNTTASSKLSSVFAGGRDAIFKGWIDNVAANERNRVSRAELERELNVHNLVPAPLAKIYA